MERWAGIFTGRLLGSVGCFAVIASPVLAQDDTAALRAEIASLKATIAKLESRLDAVEKAAPDAIQLAPAGPAPTASGPRQPARDTIGDELTGVARADTRPPPNDPELKGFWLIPGTETKVRLGGFAKVNAIYDFAPAGNPDKLVTSAIPVGVGDASNANLDANATRFSFEVRRPSSLGPLRFYLENDFYGGAGSTAFRLRQAHGQVGNLYGGYGYSGFADSDAYPETIDDEGPGGEVLLRLAALRHIRKIGHGLTATLSIEDPSSELSLVSGQRAVQLAPDVTLAMRLERDWGHLQGAALLRSIGYEEGNDDHDEIGYGLSFSGLIKVRGDFVMGAFTYGEGVGRYFNDLGGKGYDGVVTPAGDLKLLTVYGGYLGYTRHWSPRWRSSLVGGALVIEDETFLAPTAFRSSGYGALNLIWQGSPSFTVGVEALYGRLELQNGLDADVTRLQAGVKYDLVR